MKNNNRFGGPPARSQLKPAMEATKNGNAMPGSKKTITARLLLVWPFFTY
jgi:hypothetical protein